jgi:1,4-dihydroxy-2-naphthoate octaprenyltransferase
VLLSWAYNRPPLQWSYRGHGEILQGLGCGVVLPLIGFYLQRGSFELFPWPALLPLLALFWVGNLVTALPDYDSDRAGGKRTFPVRYGQSRARITALIVLALAYGSLPLVSPSLSAVQVAIIAGPAGLVLAGIVASGLATRADVSDFQSCRAFVTRVSLSQAWFLCAWITILLMERLH